MNMRSWIIRLPLLFAIWVVHAAGWGQPSSSSMDRPTTLVPAAPQNTEISLKFRPIAKGDPSRTKVWNKLLSISAPVILKIQAGETVEAAINRKCGNAQSDLVSFIKALNRDSGTVGSVENHAREWRAFPCPYWAFDTPEKPITIPATQSQTLANILPFHMGESGPVTVEAVRRLNPGVITPDGVVKKDGELRLPYTVRSTAVELNTAISTQPSAAIKLVESALPAPLKEVVFQTSAFTKPLKYRLVAEDMPTENVTVTTCNGPDATAKWPFDMQKVLETLSIDKATLGVSRPESVVLVADTGFDSTLMSSSLLWINKRVKTGKSVTDYTGDLNGANLTYDNGDIRPSSGYAQWRHGSDVFQVIAGGRTDDAKLATYIVIAAAKIDNSEEPYGIERTALHSSFYYANQIGRQNPSVVLNLSSITTGQISPLREALQATNSLVVAAAGNNHGVVEDLEIFPPAFSEYRDRLIVVGAHDWQGRIADFSNRGALVDVLAPGCKLGITAASGEMRTLSGTSFAAPFVSLTAALLSSLDMKPWEVKNRILASVDYESTLTHVVSSSGRLNLSNALRVRTDILQTRDPVSGEIRTQYGTVDTSVTWFCKTEDGASIPYRPGNIARLIGDYRGPSGKSVKIYSNPVSTGALISHPPCEGFSGAMTFEDDKDGKGPQPVEWSNIANIIFRVL